MPTYGKTKSCSVCSPPKRRAPINLYRHEAAAQKFFVFKIDGQLNGAVLTQTEVGQPIVSRHTMSKGETLFVNLQLTYLKQRTEGLFMASMLQWPRLTNTSDAVGGVVLN